MRRKERRRRKKGVLIILGDFGHFGAYIELDEGTLDVLKKEECHISCPVTRVGFGI